MSSTFDIFKRLPDGKPLWIEAVEGLDETRQCLTRLAETSPGDYFIYCEKTGGVVERLSSSEKHHRAA
jgi:hypothetical protein